MRLYHKARAFERQTRQQGNRTARSAATVLLVLHALLFDFLNYATGRLDPAIATIARKACISMRAASSAASPISNYQAC